LSGLFQTNDTEESCIPVQGKRSMSRRSNNSKQLSVLSLSSVSGCWHEDGWLEVQIGNFSSF